jgi:hypothetical protein
VRRDSTDSDREAIGGSETDPTATPDDADRTVDVRGDEETLACTAGEADPDPTTSGFVWCEQAQSPAEGEFETESEFAAESGFETESGFEWCDPEDDREQRSRSEPKGTAGAVDTAAVADDGPTGPVLDPEIVTTTRLRGIDDEAVALLSTLRRRGETRRNGRTDDE